ncbi:hypothetical protein FHS27_000491 [Rhodopirellula rubra]|uniref:Uncharacterized protein n=1 Tax=Aporhodopirellula rubra TaxID=980271 RepID=A0A7W5DV19_9BACT|nr:hypothetical protein [Aporhodopirellula rubra]MBB3204724.1 hypothetical protein [Aporhodopirellula rubra]
MSAPVPDIDQLLSDHLDGRLDENDVQTLEARLRDDAALRSQYDAMLADRQSLKEIFVSSEKTQTRLPADFASRVLAESRRRGLNIESESTTESNLVRPRTSSELASSGRMRIIAGVVTSAAAVLLLISLNWNGRTDVNSIQSIAQNDDGSATMPAELPEVTSIDQQPSAVVVGGDEPNTGAGVVPNGVAPSMMAVTPDVEPDESSVKVDVMDVAPKPAAASVASSELPAGVDASSSVSVGADDSPMFASSSLAGAMMVYDVRLSQKGRVTGVFSQAMQRNGLDESSREPLNRDVIAAAKSAEVFDQDESFQIIFLQASAKKVDRLFLDLLKDSESVESVGLSLVTDTPILRMTDQLTHVDSTEVKHQQPISLELGNGADDKELETLRDLLGEQNFMPLNAMAGNVDAASESLSSSGSDVISRVLILVR